MKARFISLLLVLVSSAPLLGTPERFITVDEVFLGSNETGFVILRTETDNHARYTTLQVTRYLDEYEKVSAKQTINSFLARRVKTTTLLDVHHFNDPPNKEQTVKAKDSSVNLADLLTKYPERAKRWEESKFAKISSWKKEGQISSSSSQMISDWHIADAAIFGIEGAEVEWNLEDAMEDMNSLYLRVSIGSMEDDEGTRQFRWICIVPDKTRQVHDHLGLQPFYLCTGSYATADEAVKQAREIVKKTKDAKPPLRTLEVWSVRPHDSTFFTITIPCSMDDMEPKKFNEFKSLLGSDLSPISNRCFVERTQVSEPP